MECKICGKLRSDHAKVLCPSCEQPIDDGHIHSPEGVSFLRNLKVINQNQSSDYFTQVV